MGYSLHPVQNRVLSSSEGAKVCCHRFVGSLRKGYENAVTPKRSLSAYVTLCFHALTLVLIR
jgi:hypothetical protein